MMLQLRSALFMVVPRPDLIMTEAEAIERLKKSCHMMGAEMMTMHPATAALADQPSKDEIYKTLFEITKQVEIIKKRLRKLQATRGGDAVADETSIL
jgi:hypothetical protein